MALLVLPATSPSCRVVPPSTPSVAGRALAAVAPVASATAGTAAPTVVEAPAPASLPVSCVACWRLPPRFPLSGWLSPPRSGTFGSIVAAEADPARTAGTAPAATTNAAWTIRRERGRDMVLLVEGGQEPSVGRTC